MTGTRTDRAWSETGYAHNGDVTLAYDRLVDSGAGSGAGSGSTAGEPTAGGVTAADPTAGEPTAAGSTGDGAPLLLVMGLATARFWWPTGLCEALADAGFAVARYDQRDAGESTRLSDTGRSNPIASLFGRRGEAYTSEDMTDDAIAVLDALGWQRAHIFGHSLGGLLAQRIALRHPDRVLSVTSSAALSSDVSGLQTLRYLRFGLLAKLARTRFPEGREGDIEASLAVWRGVASPGYPYDEDAARAWAEAQADTGPRDTAAQSRQIGAQWHGPPLRTLRRPMLVLHGEQDPLLRVAAARNTAATVPGARLVTFPGVGHDLPAPLWPLIAQELTTLTPKP